MGEGGKEKKCLPMTIRVLTRNSTVIHAEKEYKTITDCL